MASAVSTEVLYTQRRLKNIRFRNEYRMDFWREVQTRWLVFGVLGSVLLAVLAPHVGAPGGPLHTEVARYVPLSYIYYSAGRRVRAGGSSGGQVGSSGGQGGSSGGQGGRGAWPGARAVCVCVLHAHVVAPALCLLTARAFRDAGLDHRIVRGAVLSSAGAPCGWLSLALCGARSAPALLAATYLAALFAEPLAMIVLCGRATVPAVGGLLSSALMSLTPFALGALRAHLGPRGGSPQAPGAPEGDGVPHMEGKVPRAEPSAACKMAALALLYVECCERLSDAEGSLYVGDVLATLTFVLSWALGSLVFCGAYSRCRLLPSREADALRHCALPKCLDLGWLSSSACTPGGLSRLPAVFLAPTQALLLAAVRPDDHSRATDEDEGLPQ